MIGVSRRAITLALMLGLIGGLTGFTPASAATPSRQHVTKAIWTTQRVQEMVSIKEGQKSASAPSVGTVNMTWHKDYVSVAWTAPWLEFSHVHVMIVANQTPTAYTYSYAERQWANVWYSHFPPQSANHAGYAVLVDATYIFTGQVGSARLGRVQIVQSSHNVAYSGACPGCIEWNRVVSVLIPAVIKRCNKYGMLATTGPVITGVTVSALATAGVPGLGEVTVAGMAVTVGAAYTSGIIGCVALHAD